MFCYNKRDVYLFCGQRRHPLSSRQARTPGGLPTFPMRSSALRPLTSTNSSTALSTAKTRTSLWTRSIWRWISTRNCCGITSDPPPAAAGIHARFKTGTPLTQKPGLTACWVFVKQFSRNDTATACQDWLRVPG